MKGAFFIFLTEPIIRGFSFYDIFWLFSVYAVLGWCLEVVFCTVNEGKFVNRGFLNGPVCPIYGFGAVIVILCLTPLSGSVPVLFFGGMILTSLLELVTGYVLKKAFHTSWWDYTDEPFNIGGYICLKFSLGWGIACVFLMRILQPGVAFVIGLVPVGIGKILIIPVAIAFLSDVIVTVHTINAMNRDLGKLANIAEGLHNLSNDMAQNIYDGVQKLQEGQVDLALKKAELSDKRRELMEKRSLLRKRMLDAFPNMRSQLHPDALDAFRAKYKERKEGHEENDEQE